MISRRGKLLRSGIAILVAAAMVGVAGGVPMLLSPDREPVNPPTAPTEFEPENIAQNPLAAVGTVSVDAHGEGMVVLVDHAHGNRIQRGDLTPVMTALVEGGAEVRTLAPGEPLSLALEDVDALVIADPRLPYRERELDSLERFDEAGGRLLVAAEPNHRSLAPGPGSGPLQTQRSQVTELGSRFGIAFGTGYLYHLDPEMTDGNFKNVLVAGKGTGGLFEAVDRGVVYTATPVRVSDGRSVLATRPGTRIASSEPEAFPVAATTRDGKVLAIGDTTLLEPSNHRVGDNEVIVSEIVEFLLGA